MTQEAALIAAEIKNALFREITLNDEVDKMSPDWGVPIRHPVLGVRIDIPGGDGFRGHLAHAWFLRCDSSDAVS
jgi:hypothetical protein